MSVSKKFCKAEYDNLVSWLETNATQKELKLLLPWESVKGWPGHLIATMDYEAIDGIPNDKNCNQECRFWNEGYRYWWCLSNIHRLTTPIPCRGNVGMWKIPERVASLMGENKE